MNKGWKEAFTAAGIAIALGVVIFLLVGCVPMKAALEYEHHSSAQDFYDLNTSDQVGLIVTAKLCREPTFYCPELDLGLAWEVTGTPTFGRDPVGTIRLRQPVWSNRQ